MPLSIEICSATEPGKGHTATTAYCEEEGNSEGQLFYGATTEPLLYRTNQRITNRVNGGLYLLERSTCDAKTIGDDSCSSWA